MDLTIILDFTLRLTIAGIIIIRNRSSTAVRLTWVVVVLAVPFVGAALYLLFGEVWRRSGRLATHKSIIEKVRTEMTSTEHVTTLDKDAPPGTGFSLHAFQRLGGFPARYGNRLQLYSDPEEIIERIAQDIDGAEQSCHLLFYIWLDDNAGNLIADALIRANKRGVQCRVLVDGMGSSRFLRSRLKEKMVASGVEVATAFPLGRFNIRIDHRNHRKIVVIDGRVGWTGSRNMADAEFRVKPKFAPWVDVMARIAGPSVHDLQTVFIEDWLFETNTTLASLATPVPDPETGGSDVQVFAAGPTIDPRVMRQLAVIFLFLARREIVVTTPYFVPDEVSVSAYCALARSGVRTLLIVPRRNDSWLIAAASRSYYDELLDAGVEIYEYRPGLLHAKTVMIDSVWSLLDTANFDRRSFELNYEVSFVTRDQAFTSQLRELQMSYLRESERIAPDRWRDRAAFRKLLENSARLLAPLL